VTSCNFSPMLCRSSSVKVIGSIDNFDALTLLCNPTHSVGCGCFNCVDMVCGSAPPFSSSTSCPCEGDTWPSCAFAAASYVVASTATTFSCSVVVYIASCTTHTFVVAASFLLFSANCAMHILASSFLLCATYLSISAMSRVCHFRSHVSRMLKMTSSMATKGSFLHYLVGSLRTLM